jgi:hypothetical protein
VFTAQLWAKSSQAQRPREKLHGVVYRQKLTPPLRSSNNTLRYSPDGRYLMLQNPSGIYIFSREPLKFRDYIVAPHSYAAQFSSDSQFVVVLSLGLSYSRWRISDGQRMDITGISIQDGCLAARLSPDADLLACLRPDFSVAVLQLPKGESVFSDRSNSSVTDFRFYPVPLELDTAFAGPFGYFLSNDLKLLANRGLVGAVLEFSADSKSLLAGNERNALRVDLAARKKINLPGAVRKHMTGTVALQGDDRVLVVDRKEAAEPAVLSLSNGQILAKLSFEANSAHLATNPRYAVLYDSGKQGVRLFDLQENKAVRVPENVGADVFGEELATLTENGDLFIYHLGELLPFAAVSLPLDNLPILRAASLSPLFEKVAVAVEGAGGVFQLDSGNLIARLSPFSAAFFFDSAKGILLMPRVSQAPQRILQFDAKNGTTSAAWAGNVGQFYSGGPVFLEYSFESEFGLDRNIFVAQEGGIPYRLRGIDPATGKELWKRSFRNHAPIPFADPQGDRLVLGWQAKSAWSSDALQHGTHTNEVLKKAKLSDQDSFFEALDARTGKSVGGVLVQTGAGPINFDSVFSVGDAMIVLRDRLRLSLYSIRDGQLKARLVGDKPSASAQSNLLALDEDSGRLAIFDLNSGVKLDELLFPDVIAYTHFSGDGKRLFILTGHQFAFILDMSGIRESSPLTAVPDQP